MALAAVGGHWGNEHQNASAQSGKNVRKTLGTSQTAS